MNDTTSSTFEKFIYPILIRERHLDTFGHVNNATYLEIFEEARWEFVSSRGFGLKDVQKLGMGPTILECNLKFLKEIRLRQTILVESQTLSYEKKIGILRQAMVNEEGQVHSELIMTFGLFDVKERKLVLPTPEWLHAVGFIGQS